MHQDLPPLIRALLQPQRYPGRVQSVELVQTHISWVLLAGDFAYKIKKPVRLPFLDFSTLERRRVCCEDELRLNRRFAADIYLDVLAVFNTPDGPGWNGGGGPIEYAVRMRRFDENGRLDRMCRRGALLPEHLSDLATELTGFHARAAIAPVASRFGRPREVLAPALENFQELDTLLPQSAPRARLAILRRWTESRYAQREPDMQARKDTGRVRECHGDLHLANLVHIDGRVRMFDCIEFSENLRWIDVASEIAFTYVDLLDHGRPGLACWFVNEVLSANGDYGCAGVLPFYAVYRALVRAKVEAIRHAQIQDDGQEEAMAYVAMAEQLASWPKPRLIIMHGLAGCGKTVLSTRLIQTDPLACTMRLRSDVERKRLFGLGAGQHSGSATSAGIYTREAHEQTYAHLHFQCAKLLRANWSVVVDAAFLKRNERASFQALASELGVAYGILAPQAAPDVLRERIRIRQSLGCDASEATVEVLERQMSWIEPLDADERDHLLDPDAMH